MSIQSDAAKAHIEKLLIEKYGRVEEMSYSTWKHIVAVGGCVKNYIPAFWNEEGIRAYRECYFDDEHKYRFDFAVPASRVAIEIQGGNFVKGAHSNPASLRKSYERSNRATELGWRVWYFMPEHVVKCKVGRKTMPDEIIPVLTKLPWV